MKASEAIKRLQELVDRHGDCEIAYPAYDGEQGYFSVTWATSESSVVPVPGYKFKRAEPFAHYEPPPSRVFVFYN